MWSVKNTLLLASVVLLICWEPTAHAKPPVRRYCGALLTQRMYSICRGLKDDTPIRIRRGIIENCCSQPCSVSTLSSYCGEPEDVETAPEHEENDEEVLHRILAADMEYRSQTRPEGVTTPKPVTSKLQIGRVEKDFYSWTYAG